MATSKTIPYIFQNYFTGQAPRPILGDQLNANFTASLENTTLQLELLGDTALDLNQATFTGYEFSGSLGSSAAITWPEFTGLGVIQNATSGGQSIVCGVSGLGDQITIFNGEIIDFWSDGTNFFRLSAFGNGFPVTGSGAVVLQEGPTIDNPTFTGIVTGLNISDFLAQAHYAGTGTVSLSDVGKTIIMDGAGFYTVSLSAPSEYPSNSLFLFVNASTTRGKLVNPNGQAAFILWPRQTILIQNINNVWVYETSRWAPTGNVTYYVDNVNGSDASDGLDSSGHGSGCFQTVQHAYNTILQFIDAQSAITATIQLPPDTSGSPITEQCNISGMVSGVAYDVEIVGNPSSPDLCLWFSPTGGDLPLLSIADWATITLNGISFGCTTGNVPALIQCRQLCICDMVNLFLANNPTQVALKILDNGRMNLLGNIIISGSYEAFIQILYDGSMDGQGCNFPINLTPNVGTFVQIIGSGSVNLTGITFSGAVSAIGGTINDLNGPCCLITSGTVTWPPFVTGGSAINGGVVI